ncbi:MAG: hypothetical protein IJZ10_07815 [Thermoguttaceae bacterium]|nr:hypothetical protein [Thermoguttaceae bacterium]
MFAFSLAPFRRSKRVALFFATLTLGGLPDFASSPIFPQTPVLRNFADLPYSAVFAQEEAPEWDALLERRDGWLAADGIYSVELGRDAAANDANASNAVKVDANSPTSPNLTALTAPTARKTLFLFSDTFGGSTKNDGRDFGERTMTNHSFAVLTGTAPNPEKIAFFWRRAPENGEFTPIKQDSRPSENASKRENSETGEETPTLPERLAPRNPLGVDRWLQDGVVWRGRVWTSALLVGAGWKPERVDAVSLGLDANGSPDFNDVRIDETAPFSFKTEKAQVVFGAAICDDAEDGFLYVFGYLDRFDVGSRKDLVVARAPRASFGDFSTWRYFDGRGWSPNVADAARPEAGLVERVSTEFSVSKIPSGANAGRYLLVYTPGVIGNEIAFRVGETPCGPFGPETVFYRSTVPRQFERGVRCYNAKAHPAFGDGEKILVSYNVNRLGTLPRRPAEYRPRFVWLRYSTVDAAVASREQNAR